MITVGVLEADLSHRNSMVYVRFSRAREVNPAGGEMEILRDRMKNIIENSKNSHDLLRGELAQIDLKVREATKIPPKNLPYQIAGMRRR